MPERSLLTPEAVAMLGVALFCDISEILLAFIPVVGVILSFVVELIALIFIGGWMLFRSGTVTSKRELKKTISKAAKNAAKWGKRLKWLKPLTIIIEMIPGLDFLPMWTIAVYLELKYGGS